MKGTIIPVRIGNVPFSFGAEDVVRFVKEFGIQDFEVFMSVHVKGAFKGQTNGIYFTLLFSKSDADHITSASRGRRIGERMCEVVLSSLDEMKEHELHPNPSALFLKEMQGSSGSSNVRHQPIDSKPPMRYQDKSRPVDSSRRPPRGAPVQMPANDFYPNAPLARRDDEFERKRDRSERYFNEDPYRKGSPIQVTSGRTDKRNSSIDNRSRRDARRESPRDSRRHEDYDSRRDISRGARSAVRYECFLKIFPVSEKCSLVTIEDFFRPVKCRRVLFSYFEDGPHRGCARSEAFVEFSSYEDALRGASLNSKELDTFRVVIVFPTKEEIDMVLWQCEKRDSRNRSVGRYDRDDRPRRVRDDRDELDNGKERSYSSKYRTDSRSPPRERSPYGRGDNRHRGDYRNDFSERVELRPGIPDHVTYAGSGYNFREVQPEFTAVPNIVPVAPYDHMRPAQMMPVMKAPIQDRAGCNMRINNTSTSTKPIDILDFFKGYHILSDTLRQVSDPSKPGCKEWTISFFHANEALRAFNSLNRKPISQRPAELFIF